jgi:MEDS: MEthanogen/methylotroph, DcmR Sensory domain
MYIMSVVHLFLYIYMAVEPRLHAHTIGFLYQNSDSSNENDKQEDGIKTADLNSLYKPLYQLSNKYLQNGYSVLYAAESLPDDRDKAKVAENIQKANNTDHNQADNVQNKISKGLLNVVNSDTTYKDNSSGRDIVDFLLSNVSEMQRKSKQQEKTKGSVIFNAPDPFFSRDKYDVFIDFEEEMTRTLPNDVSLLCWYKRRWLNNFSLGYIISILAHHKYTIHNNWKYKQWDTSKIIEVISKGIDNNLGEGSSVLLFQTLKSAYKLKQEVIVRKPNVFEERLKRVLGKDDANSVINSIFEEIIKEVEFSLIGNGSNSKKR